MRKSSMSQRLLSFVLAFVMVFTMVPVQAFAAEDVDHVHVQETTVPTEETTVPTTEAVLEAAETEEPTQITTEAPTEVTVVTEPVVETTETTEATEEATEAPTEETVPEETEEEVEELLFASVAAANATTPTYIASIGIAQDASSGNTGINDCKNELAGHTIINRDLNDGAGGDYIYMGYKTTTDPTEAITGIVFRVGENPSDRITYGGYTFHLVGGRYEINTASQGGAIDLNADAGGVYIYTYVTRDPGYGPALTALTVNESSSYSGWSTGTNTSGSVIDLNQGAGGEYLYLHYQRFSGTASATFHYLNATGACVSTTTSVPVNNHNQAVNTTPSIPSTVTYDGRTFTFRGWREDNTATDSYVTPSYANSNSRVYCAVYSGTLTVSYNANGGSGAPSSQTETQYVNAGTFPANRSSHRFIVSETSTYTHPSKCKFLGWCTTSSSRTETYAPGTAIRISSNILLYAIYDSTHNPYADDGDCTTAVYCRDCGKVTTAATEHSGSKSYKNNGSDHTYTWSCCGKSVTEAHSYDAATLLCVCGAVNPEAVATLSKNGKVVFAGTTLDAVITEAEKCTAADKAVVTILKNIDLGENYQSIDSGVFTIDLNGKTVSSVDSNAVLQLDGDVDVTILDSKVDGTITGEGDGIYAWRGAAVTISSGTITGGDCGVLVQSDSTATISGGTISGRTYGVNVVDDSTVTINGGIISSGNAGVTVTIGSTVAINGGTITADEFGVYVDEGTATISGGTISGESLYDIIKDHTTDAITLIPGENGVGATFPGGIKVYDTTLNEILGEGAAYWQGSTMILPAEGATEISRGDVTVKAECTHASGTKENYVNNGEDHTYTWSCCKASVTEEHEYDETTNVCACGAVNPEAVATVSKKDKIVSAHATLDSAITAVRSATAADEAVVTLLKEIDLGDNSQTISGGVFTINLNGKSVSGGNWAFYQNGTGSEVTIDGEGTLSGIVGYQLTDGTLIVKGGTFQGGLAAIDTTTIYGGSFVGESHGIYSASISPLTIYGGSFSGEQAVFKREGTLTIYGGSFTGTENDLFCWGTMVLELGENGTGATFPGGITVTGDGLNAILAEGAAYWAGDTMLSVDDKAEEITDKGDITVKAKCTHENGEKNYVNNGEDHTYTYSCCNLTVTEGHSYEEATGLCECGAVNPEAVASVTIGENVSYYTTLDAAIQAVEGCAEEDEAVVTLLKSMELTSTQLIFSGVFTLDLKGCTVTSEGYVFEVFSGGVDMTVTDSTDSPGSLIAGESTTAIVMYDGSVAIEKGNFQGDGGAIYQHDGTLTIEGGTFRSTYNQVIANGGGTLALKGGTLEASENCSSWIYVNRTAAVSGAPQFTGGESWVDHFFLCGKLDLSGMTDPTGLTVRNETGAAVAASEIPLPEGLSFLRDGAIAETLENDTCYTIGKDVTAPAVFAGSGSRNSNNSASVSFDVGEDCTYYYAVVDQGAEMPVIDTTGAGTACEEGTVTVTLTGLTVSAKEFYVVAKDAAGNVSEPVKVEIPAGALSIELYLKAVDAKGKEIAGALDALLNYERWAGTESMGYGQPYMVNIGENTLSGWALCPEGYARPTEAITFTADEDGNITITSGNATVEVVENKVYIVVTLTATHVQMELYLKAVDAEGKEIAGDLDAMLTDVGWVGTEACGYDQPYMVIIGENTLSDWYGCPAGYDDPEDITFTVDEDGNITITSGNATVEKVENRVYIVVTLTATHVQTELYLKAVDAKGKEIACDLDAELNDNCYVGTESCGYDQPYMVIIGENTLSDWYGCPAGYDDPEDITFTVDEDGNITITSGNATAEQVGDAWYIVVTLTQNGWPIWVAGTMITADNCADVLGDGTVSYDPENNVLTLENAVIETENFDGIYSEQSLTIRLVGANVIRTNDNGIYFDGATDAVITGTGSMEIYSDNEAIDMYGPETNLTLSGSAVITLETNNNEGIYLSAEEASLVIQDEVQLTIGTEETPNREEAVYIFADISGAVTIQDEANVSIYTSDEEGIYVGGSEQTLTISGGTVYVIADAEALDVGTVAISGGTVTAIGGDGCEGIYAENLTISGGSILAGTITGEAGDGVEADHITITGGALRVTGGGLIASITEENGDKIPGTITLGEGMIIVTPEGGKLGEIDLSEYEEGTVLAVLNSDGSFADALVITDGETKVPTAPRIVSIYLGGVGMADGEYLAVGADAVTDTRPTEGGYAYYADGVLTLHNYTYSGEGYVYDNYNYAAALYTRNALTLVLEGDNSLTCSSEAYVSSGADAYAGLEITGTGTLALSGGIYGFYVEDDLVIKSGIVKAAYTDDRDDWTKYGICVYDGAATITGGTVEVTKGGLKANMWDAEVQEDVPSAITLENVQVMEPEGGQVGVYEGYCTIVDAEGNYADAFIITDGKEPGPAYSGWTEIEGDWYYYDPETNEPVTGVSRVPYPTEPINGITYAPDQETLDYCAGKGIEFIDAEEAWFCFDDEDGKFLQMTNGITTLGDRVARKLINGQIPWHPGLVQVPGNTKDYFYFIGDEEIGGNKPANGDVYVQRNRTDRNVVLGGVYTFNEEGRLCEYDGITDMANGTKRYYEDAQLMAGNGLTEVNGNYIYVRSNGELVVNSNYYIAGTDLPIAPGMYDFDSHGYLINPVSTDKNGIYEEAGKLYYYENGLIAYNAGLIYAENLTWHLDEGTAEYTGYIYVRSNGQLATGKYWITTVNETGYKHGFYTFSEDNGIMEAVKDGIVAENNSLYYYKANQLQYNAGVIELNGNYYYVRSNGEVVHGKPYWITNVGQSGVVAKLYEFDANGVMQEPDFINESGIVDGYYYVNGNKAYGAGIVKLSDENGEFYIYVRSDASLATGEYWPTTTNGYLDPGLYDWGTDGKLYI